MGLFFVENQANSYLLVVDSCRGKGGKTGRSQHRLHASGLGNHAE